MAYRVNEKQPLECTSIEEVRNEIDNIDREIINLLATRFEYVREVVKYKDGTASGIEAPERRNAVLKSRGEWAQNVGLDSEVIEDIYNRLVAYYIKEEKDIVGVKN